MNSDNVRPKKYNLSFGSVLFSAIAIMMFSSGTNLVAQDIHSSIYGDLKWRLVGPFRGGRALAAEGVSGSPSSFYFGSVDGGMWKTENGGVTWQSISDGLTNPSIGALAISASNPNIIYAGTGEADMRSDITYGDGVFKSTDAGSHWSHIGLEDSRHVGRILVDPKNPDLVLVAALGHAYGPNDERGVFRTTDGGTTWKKVLYKNQDIGAIDLAWDSQHPDIVYAALWQARRTPWSQYPPDEGAGSGIFKSTDEGTTWTEVGSIGLPAKPFGRIGVAVVEGSAGKNVYALVQDLKKGSGLYRSYDSGETWTLASSDRRIISRMWYFSQVFIDPGNANVVYCPNVALMRSTDGGKTFDAIKGAPGGDDYHYMWIDPANSRSMIVASDQGTVVSVDGAKTWSSWYNQPTGQFYHVSTDNEFPFMIYGAQQDNGTAAITSRSDFGTITFRDWHPVGAGESGYITPDPENPDIVYGGDTYGAVFRFDTRTGQSEDISPTLLAEFGKPVSSRRFRFTWTSPIVFDRRDSAVLYLGSQKLLKTSNGGKSWEPISPDLTRITRTASDSTHKGWGVIYTIAPSPIRAKMIWIGTDDGNIQLTLDGGAHWENVTPAGLPQWSKIGMIEASPFDPAEAYAAVDRHRLDDFAPYIYRTEDFGKHWTRADSGIGASSYVNVVRSDLTRRGLLYAGTETGVYVSFDNGERWKPLQQNLPIASVRDLAVHDNDLVAATHGRAFWILDDLTPLQQMSESVIESDAYLFKPETAIRIRRSENRDTPLPPEEPQGMNPPDGAIIDYFLKSVPSEPITLDILDAAGDTVSHFASDEFVQNVNRNVPIAPYWLPEAQTPGEKSGVNRFVWNLRYPSPASSHYDYGMGVANLKSVKEPEGPLVLPSMYTVKLAVAGRVYSQPLEVKLDPRVKVSEKILDKQLELALRIWNSVSDVSALSRTIDSVQVQLSSIANQPSLNPSLHSSLQVLIAGVNAFADSLNFDGLAALQDAVMSADREPTDQTYADFMTLRTRLDRLMNEWNAFYPSRFDEINGSLQKASLKEITVGDENPVHIPFPRLR